MKRPLMIGAVLFVLALSALVYVLSAPKDTEPIQTQQTDNTTSKTCTTYDGKVEEQCIEDYVGLTEASAVQRAKDHGYTPYVYRSTKARPIVTDNSPTPIYLIIRDGLVDKAYFLNGD